MKSLKVLVLSMVPLALGASISSSLLAASISSGQHYLYQTKEYCLTRYAPDVQVTTFTQTLDVFANETNTRCQARYTSGSAQLIVNTTTYSVTQTALPWTRTITTTPSITITPVASTTLFSSTTTETITSTADTPIATTTTTSVVTDTSTATTTSTTTETDTLTLTSTQTVSQTTTVPTVAGFTPAASLGSVVDNGGAEEYSSGSTRRGRRSNLSKKGELGTHPRPRQATNGTSLQLPKGRPSAVVCYQNVEAYYYTTKTVTAAPTTFTAPAPPANSSTTTVVSTFHTTITPAATTITASAASTTTSTTTSTASATITTTATLTSTTTSFVPLATSYAACAANNLVSGVGGNLVRDFGGGTSHVGFTSVKDIASASGCCAACQAVESCAGFGFSLHGAFDCIVITNTATCAPSVADWDFFSGGFDSYNFVIGDGNCGQGQWYGPS